jgi:ATP-dependent Clp protease protease subunit
MVGLDVANGLKERWIRFQGNVYDKTANALTQIVDGCLGSGIDRIHLMISSNGGLVYYGSNLYSQLKRLPIKISTYNISTVESVAVPLFCAGDERYCVPEANFMIHPVLLQPVPNQFFNALQFQELSNMCTIQTRSIANIIATSTGQPLDQVYEDMMGTTRLNAQQSQSYGLVNNVVTELLPPDTELTAIYEDGSVQKFPPSAAARIQKLPDLMATLNLSFPGATGTPGAPAGFN